MKQFLIIIILFFIIYKIINKKSKKEQFADDCQNSNAIFDIDYAKNNNISCEKNIGESCESDYDCINWYSLNEDKKTICCVGKCQLNKDKCATQKKGEKCVINRDCGIEKNIKLKCCGEKGNKTCKEPILTIGKNNKTKLNRYLSNTICDIDSSDDYEKNYYMEGERSWCPDDEGFHKIKNKTNIHKYKKHGETCFCD